MTPNRKRLVAGVVVVVVAAVVVLSIVAGRRGAGNPVAATTSGTATSSSAATGSPTSSARSSSATAGPTGSPTSSAPTAPSSSAPVSSSNTAPTPAPAPVGVVVTVASWNSLASDVEFGAFVQGVVETGGTCVVTMTKGSQQATGRAAALPNAKNTSCGDLRVAGSAVSTGSWTATVTYTSPTSAGTSAPTTVEVP